MGFSKIFRINLKKNFFKLNQNNYIFTRKIEEELKVCRGLVPPGCPGC